MSRTLKIVVKVPDAETQVLPIEVKVAEPAETDEAGGFDDDFDDEVAGDEVDDDGVGDDEGGIPDRDGDGGVVDHSLLPIDPRHEEVYNLYCDHLRLVWTPGDIARVSSQNIDAGELLGLFASTVSILSRFDGMVGDNSIATFIHDTNADGRFKEAAAYYTAQQYLEMTHNLVLAKMSESISPSGRSSTLRSESVKLSREAEAMATWVHRHTDASVYSFPHRFGAMACAKGIMRGALLNSLLVSTGKEWTAPIERILTETNIHVYAATVIYQMMSMYHEMTRMKQDNFAGVVREATSLTEALLRELLPRGTSVDERTGLHTIANKVCALFGYNSIFPEVGRGKAALKPFLAHVRPFTETTARVTRREDTEEEFTVDLQRQY